MVHGGDLDWALKATSGRLPAEPGEIYTIRYTLKNSGKSTCRPSVILYDASGHSLSWSYGGREEKPLGVWRECETRFVIPAGGAAIEPRIIGHGETDVYIEHLEFERTGRLDFGKVSGVRVVENSVLKATFDLSDASFTILDKRVGREWGQTTPMRGLFVLDATATDSAEGAGERFELFDPENCESFTATVTLCGDSPELLVTTHMAPETSLETYVSYPYPIASLPGDRVVLPVNEGISFPVTEPAPSVTDMHTFGGHGLCMSFWGLTKDTIIPEEAYGLMGLIETPDDSGVFTSSRRSVGRELASAASESGSVANTSGTGSESETLSLGTIWHPTKNQFGYDRRIRLTAFSSGGYVAIAKRYRRYASEIGRLVTFEEKIRRNPGLKEGLDRLLGAANIWAWDGAPTETVARLRELGFKHILWSGGGSASEIAKLNALDGVLTSKYDIYQDVMDPARYPELSAIHSEWVPAAWPQDLCWDSPDGDWTRGWEVDQKDITLPRIPCGVLCDSKAVGYATKRIGEELTRIPYRARFLDTTVASPWRECWHPEHPQTRTDSKRSRMSLLGLLGERFNLVCGSETGIDASVPYCDFYEGMMSLGPYRCPESGRYITKIWDEVPEVVEKYQLGEEYRLPLFELVYHDCVVSYWYWGDHNNKFPSRWWKRDLFNALYGVPPMYGFLKDFLRDHASEFAASYRTSEPVSLLTGRSEMTDHRSLTPDRRVQRTTFANGFEVVVNFGDEEYRDSSTGRVVPGRGARVYRDGSEFELSGL